MTTPLLSQYGSIKKQYPDAILFFRLGDFYENPAVAKGIVRREVVRVFTPALIADPDLVSETVSNWIFSVCSFENNMDVCLFDLLANQTKAGVLTLPELQDLISQFAPRELLIKSGDSNSGWLKQLNDHALTHSLVRYYR